MHRFRIIETLVIISVAHFLYTGCQPDERNPHSHPNSKNKTVTQDVTVGGKVWKINPDLSYQATGIWTNPNPRSLTDVEKARLNSIQAEAQKLRAKLDELDKESNVLHRIQQPQIKVRYRFGKPPHLSDEGIFDLGEFPMELEDGEFQFQMESPTQIHMK